MISRLWVILCAFYLAASLEYKHDYRGFDDSILYEIDWPGKSTAEDLEFLQVRMGKDFSGTRMGFRG